MKNDKPQVETKVQTKLKLTTKINIILGMISALFIGVMLFNAAYLTTPLTVTTQTQGETDVIAPLIKINNPKTLQEFKVGDKIDVIFNTYDNSGLVDVKIFINDTLKTSMLNLENGDHNLSWDTGSYKAGIYTLYGQATDKAGNVGALSNRVDNKINSPSQNK